MADALTRAVLARPVTDRGPASKAWTIRSLVGSARTSSVAIAIRTWALVSLFVAERDRLLADVSEPTLRY